VTVKPGAVPSSDGRPQAPHIDVLIFARGLLRQLVTRIYFPDEEAANAADPLLSSIEDPAARSTLVARWLDGALEFDVRLQGDNQTAFFEI
jgi:protocatechuate 3,4-dioxygenase alpha subunit